MFHHARDKGKRSFADCQFWFINWQIWRFDPNRLLSRNQKSRPNHRVAAGILQHPAHQCHRPS
jgi:hypothetical protein